MNSVNSKSLYKYIYTSGEGEHNIRSKDGIFITKMRSYIQLMNLSNKNSSLVLLEVAVLNIAFWSIV